MSEIFLCKPCKIAANEREAVRRLARIINTNFAAGDLWLQLKYDDERLPARPINSRKSPRGLTTTRPTAKVDPPQPNRTSLFDLERKKAEADMEPVRMCAAAEWSARLLTPRHSRDKGPCAMCKRRRFGDYYNPIRKRRKPKE